MKIFGQKKLIVDRERENREKNVNNNKRACVQMMMKNISRVLAGQ
jgi:hypothetical protein